LLSYRDIGRNHNSMNTDEGDDDRPVTSAAAVFSIVG
jgi:hypothetical protein